MPYIVSVLPFLLCPLAMGVMMWVMMRNMNTMGGTGGMGARHGQIDGQADGQADGRAVPLLEADPVAPHERAPNEEIALLRARITQAQAQLETLEALSDKPDTSDTSDDRFLDVETVRRLQS